MSAVNDPLRLALNGTQIVAQIDYALVRLRIDLMPVVDIVSG